MKKNGKEQESSDSGGKVKLHHPILGNTLIFLDTGFFKNYKARDQVYQTIFQYSQDARIILCTSDLCLEEWRAQKIQHMQSYLQTWKSQWSQNVVSHCGENFFSQELLIAPLEETLSNLCDTDGVQKNSRKVVENFLSTYKIKRYVMLERHIQPTWEGYLQGKPPYKKRKEKNDIPDAWVYEAAKDALSDPELQERKNRLCISSDGTMCKALEELQFTAISVDDLLSAIKEEEQSIITSQPDTTPESTSITTSSATSPLDSLLSKALDGHQPIWLRLLGFVEALDAPTHEELISSVATNLNANLELVATSAKYLASGKYLNDTGSHYIIGNKAICKEAADRLTDEIIKMLGLGA
jgi:hypothetical protein